MQRPASLSLTVPPTSGSSNKSSSKPSSRGASKHSSPATALVGSMPFAAVPSPITRQHKPSRSEITITENTNTQNSDTPTSAHDITSLPPFPASPSGPNRSAREGSKGFFSNLKASRSANKIQTMEGTIRQVSDEHSGEQMAPQIGSIYSLQRAPGSTPDVNLSSLEISSSDEQKGRLKPSQEALQRPTAKVGESDSAILHVPEASQSKKSRQRFGNLINRSRSTRVEELEQSRRSKSATPSSTLESAGRATIDSIDEGEDHASSLSARITGTSSDRSLRDVNLPVGSRNRSTDRESSNHSSENVVHQPRRYGASSLTPQSQSQSQSQGGLSNSTSNMFREGTGSHLFHNIKNTSTKAADGLGRAGKGILGKMNRKDSNTTEKDTPYVLGVINLPLVEQTRKTRIAARLEDSKDKTEFWMPALPWRCIDYLNFRGCEEEGLYRVPGSDKEIRHWQKRFDKEGDINLFHESDLYDINIIGSMFKAWLRELPTEILPKTVQARVAQECADVPLGGPVPQVFKDELSNLPPWNYYLLFAITCHLSLLTAYSDKNKMTYTNLCICFQPALRIDPFCFQFLVQQWRECWQGCYTEKDALLDEYRVLNGLSSSSSHSSNDSTAIAEEDRIPTHSSSHVTSRGQSPHGPGIQGRGSHSRLPPLSTGVSRSAANTDLGRGSAPPSATPHASSASASSTSASASASGPGSGSGPAYAEKSSMKTTPMSSSKSQYREQSKGQTSSHPPELTPVQPLSPIGDF